MDIIILIAAFFSVMIGAWAISLNRSGIGWFAVSLLISPLLAVLILLVIGKAKED